MPNFRLTELVTLSGSAFTGDDLLYIVDNTTNTSRKITFDTLAGNGLATLSAYDTNNNSVVEYLSTVIDDNTLSIENGETTSSELVNDVNFLSGSINLNTADILSVSGVVVASDIGGLTTDLLIISGIAVALSSQNTDNENALTAGQAEVAFLSANVDYLSGQIDLL